MIRRRPPRRHGFVLVVVLVIVAIALLVATSLIFVTQTEAAGAAREQDAAQSRALAWSGVQAYMRDLDEQRDEMLGGRAAVLDDELIIYETPRRLGVVRLLPLTPAGDRVVAEAGRLDLNTIDATRLAATGLVDEPTAAAIVTHRERRPGGVFHSVAELLEVEGVTAELVYGPVEAITFEDEAVGAAGDASPRGLADVVTVWAVEPALQRTGRTRIPVDVGWSDQLARGLERRFGAPRTDAIRRVFGGPSGDDARLCASLRAAGIAPDEWAEVLDAVTTDAGGLHFGRLDINSASYEAFRSLPGVTAEQATRLTRARQSLGDDDRATVTWPITAGILDASAYDVLGGLLTTRSFTYRLRLAAGEIDDERVDAPLENPVVWEAVIDLAGPRPRVAYLRDVSLLEMAAMLAVEAREAGNDAAAAREESAAAAPVDPDPAFETGPERVEATDAAAVEAPAGDDVEPGGARTRLGRWAKGG